jgi:hypothetical protein
MIAGRAWEILGLQPTGELAAIKRAYAAKLKSIDPDQDLPAFLKLRDAFEFARRHAARANRPPEDNLLDPEDLDADMAADFDTNEPPPEHDRTGEAVDPQAAEPERDPRADLYKLLWNNAPPEPAVAQPIVMALLHHPNMELVDFANETEAWLAQIAIETIPRSDPILSLLDAHFGWQKLEDSVRLNPAVAGVLRRIKDLDAIERLQSPTHRWNETFLLLQQPASPPLAPRDQSLHLTAVGEMLDSLRYHNPGLLWSLDQDHLALWEAAIAERKRNPAAQRSDGISWFGWLVVATAIFNIVALAT